MHVYGGRAQPRVLDRWPAPSTPAGRTTSPRPVVWAAPKLATRVELPPPAVWAAPTPDRFASISIAALRLVPVCWGPPEVVHAPWGPPALERTDDAAEVSATAARRFPRTRAMAYGLAAAAVAVGTFAVVVLR